MKHNPLRHAFNDIPKGMENKTERKIDEKSIEFEFVNVNGLTDELDSSIWTIFQIEMNPLQARYYKLFGTRRQIQFVANDGPTAMCGQKLSPPLEMNGKNSVLGAAVQPDNRRRRKQFDATELNVSVNFQRGAAFSFTLRGIFHISHYQWNELI